MSLPKISIIIPLYNVAEYIEQCLQSVANQTYIGEIECIIVDDCGTDNSVQIAENFIANYNGSIQFRILHHNHNRGLSAARNTGVDAAKGESLFFLDSDDILNQNTLQTLYTLLTDNEEVGIAAVLPYTFPKGAESFVDVSRWEHKDGKSKVISANDFNMAMLRQDVFHTAWGKLIRRDLIGDIRFIEGRNNEDTRFWFDLSENVERTGYSFVELPNQLYGYRINNQGICANMLKLNLDILRNWIDIRDTARTENVRKYAWQKAFDFDYQLLRQHANDDAFYWIREDLKNYSVIDVRKMCYPWTKCLHFVIYKSKFLSSLIKK